MPITVSPVAQTTTPTSITITQAFARWVAARPGARAVGFREASLTYRELDERASRIARWIEARAGLPSGDGGERLIPFCLQQGPDSVAVMLAILKLGGAYVPIDPDFPASRIRYMLKDIGARFVITERGLAGDLLGAMGDDDRALEMLEVDTEDLDITRQSADPVEVAIRPDSLCYVMYTSGSTGRPKGVAICHQGVTRLVLDTNYITITKEDCLAQAANIAFDAATFEIWGALLNGASVAILARDVLLDPRRLAAAIRESGVTTMFLTTGLFNQHVAADPEMFGPLRVLLFGGEAASSDAVRRLLSAARAPQHLVHLYGPTENTTLSTFYPVIAPPEPGAPVPIGEAISSSTCVVVNEAMELIEGGEPGELLVGGTGLARGYLHNPDETARRFIDDPFTRDGSKLYRTGDVVRRLPGGALVFVGRVDNQVKIRGFRIELEEIELALDAHPAIGGAAVLVRDDGSGIKRLVAYLHPAGEAALPPIEALRAFLEDKLPYYMIPSTFVRVEAFPLSPTGKVDRRALDRIPGELMSAEQVYVAPRDEDEQRLQSLWAQHLRCSPSEIGVEHDFFELGGQSLVAARIVSDLREALGVELRLRDFYAAPTVAGLAAAIRRADRVQKQAIPRVEGDSGLPLSWSQEQIWLHQQLDPEVPFYNEPIDLTLPEAIHVPSLERALAAVVERHEALRLRIEVVQGKLVQRIVPFEVVRLPFSDFRHLPRARAEAEALALATEAAKRVFDLAREPLIRFHLVRLEEQRYRLFLTGHHLVLDGVGIFQVFLPELEAAYRCFVKGEPFAPAPLAFRYRDHVVWQRDAASLARWAGQASYWQGQLSNIEPLQLPTDRTLSAKESFAGARRVFGFSRRLTHQVHELSRRHGVSLFTTLLAAFKTLLFRTTQQTDLTVATVVGGRDLAGLEQHIGDFLNTLLLRTRLPRNGSFLDVLGAVRTTCRDAFAHQEVPFQIVAGQASSAPGAERRIPIQVAFVLEPEVTRSPGGWELTGLTVQTDTAKFDLTFELDEREGHLIGRVEYRTDLFEAETIARMIRHFEVLLDGIVTTPERPIGELSLLDEEERQRLLVDWNDNQVRYEGVQTLHGLIEAQAARTPEASAVLFEDEALSFRELDERANQLAHRLCALGAGPDQLILVWTERSADHLVIQLGILKSGAAYVPIAPDEPTARAQHILDDTRARILVCDRDRQGRLSGPGLQVLGYEDEREALAREPLTRPETRVEPHHLAYVIFTSGSTGRPKGVMIEHHQIADRVQWAGAHLRSSPGDVGLHVFSLAFDGATIPTWFNLAHGAAVVMPTSAAAQDPAQLCDLIRRHAVTLLAATPTLWTVLAGELERAGEPGLRACMAGGERLTGELAERLKRLAPRVLNLYGPTEATVLATAWDATRATVARPPIGAGIANTPLYVLDEQRQLVPIGVPGELYIGGLGVARGYLNRPELTDRHFSADPFSSSPGARIYRTGDVVRWLSSGELDYLGRADDQVKIRGFRVELGEIEDAIRAHAGVQGCAVVARATDAGSKRLLAYVVGPRDLAELRAHLKATLPPAMVPAVLVPLTELPMTANGKVDVRALPEPADSPGDKGPERVAPRSTLELKLHAIWASVLGHRNLGVVDDFHDLGGDSILSLQVVARAGEQGLAMGIRDLHEAPTIAGLAARLSAAGHASHFAGHAHYARCSHEDDGDQELTGPCPLAPIQRWFFEQGLQEPNHFNQAFVFEVRRTMDPTLLDRALRALVRHHDALRLRYARRDGVWTQEYAPLDAVGIAPRVEVVSLRGALDDAAPATLAEHAERAQRGFDIERGPVLSALLFDRGEAPQRLWIGVHHLVIDGVSWRVLAEDLATAYEQLEAGSDVKLPAKSGSFRRYVHALEDHAKDEAVREAGTWRAGSREPIATLPRDRPVGVGAVSSQRTVSTTLSAAATTDLLHRARRASGADVRTVLLTALHSAIAAFQGRREVGLWLEGHGREPLSDDVDVTRTVGWFTSLFPLRLGGDPAAAPRERLLAVKRELAALPHNGLGYGVLRYLGRGPGSDALAATPSPEVSFNYLGQLDSGQSEGGLLQLTSAPAGAFVGPANPRHVALDINGFVIGGELQIDWSYSRDQYDEATIQRLAAAFLDELTGLIQYCVAQPRPAHSTGVVASRLGNPLVPLHPHGSRPPLFLAHPAGGLCLPYSVILGHIHPDQPVYGLNDPRFGKKDRPFGSLDDLASFYADAVQRQRPTGPYRLGGWSFGALCALSIARQLTERGEDVEAVILFDDGELGHRDDVDFESHLAGAIDEFLAATAVQPGTEQATWFAEELRFTHRLALEHLPARYEGRVILVRSLENLRRAAASSPPAAGVFLGLDELVTSRPIELRVISGEHLETFAPERGAEVGALVDAVLSQCEVGAPSPEVVTTMNELLLEALARRDWQRLLRIQAVFGGLGQTSAAPPPEPATLADPEGLAPRDPTEKAIARLLGALLGRDTVPVDAGFFTLGGTSLTAVHLLSDIEHELGVRLPVSVVLRGGTVAQLAEEIRAGGASTGSLIKLRAGGSRPALFCVHPAGGSAFSYQYLTEHLGNEQPVHGLECVDGYQGKTLETMSGGYVRAIREVQPEGPYYLGGWSLGGILAFEMARQLEAEGAAVALVVLIDCRPTTHARQMDYLRHMNEDDSALLALMGRHLAIMADRPFPVDRAALCAQPAATREAWFIEQVAAHGLFPATALTHFVRRFIDDFRSCNGMMLDHGASAPIEADLVLLRAADISAHYEDFPALEEPVEHGSDTSYGWAALTRGRVTVRMVPGTHETLVFEPRVADLAREVGAALAHRAHELRAAADPPAFKELGEAEWKKLLEHTTPIQFRPGDVLIEQGDESDSMYLVAEGQLEVVVQTPNGERRRLHISGPSTVLGEMAFLDGQPRSASVVALVDGSAYRLTMADFARLRQDEPALALAVLMDIARVVTQRLRASVS